MQCGIMSAFGGKADIAPPFSEGERVGMPATPTRFCALGSTRRARADGTRRLSPAATRSLPRVSHLKLLRMPAPSSTHHNVTRNTLPLALQTGPKRTITGTDSTYDWGEDGKQFILHKQHGPKVRTNWGLQMRMWSWIVSFFTARYETVELYELLENGENSELLDYVEHCELRQSVHKNIFLIAAFICVFYTLHIALIENDKIALAAGILTPLCGFFAYYFRETMERVNLVLTIRNLKKYSENPSNQ